MKKRDYSDELAPNVQEQMKKNLVYVGIFSVVMIFAGFTSAYIVSMGDTFWVKYPFPPAFWISTAFIVLSSIFYQWAISQGKKQAVGKVRIGMLLTLFFGVLFAVFQFKGYGALIQEGAAPTGPVIVSEGKYGDYFEIKYKGAFIEVNGNKYLWKGKELTEQQWKELRAFASIFESKANIKGYSITEKLNPDFTLYYSNEPLQIQNGKLITPSGKELAYTDMRRLMFLTWNIRDGRGDFFHKGEIGKDFHIYYKGKELSYKDRTLFYNDQPLSAPLQIKANQTKDLATSYLYIITVLHLLHVLATIIYLIKMVKISYSGDFTERKLLSIRLGAIFWHFLGLLWLFLLVFLLFIH